MQELTEKSHPNWSKRGENEFWSSLWVNSILRKILRICIISVSNLARKYVCLHLLMFPQLWWGHVSNLGPISASEEYTALIGHELGQANVHWGSDAIQSSYPLLPPSLHALNLSQHQGLFQLVSSLDQVIKELELQLQHQSFQWTLRTDFLLDWPVWFHCTPRDSQESSASQFESNNSLVLRLLYVFSLEVRKFLITHKKIRADLDECWLKVENTDSVEK